MRRIAVDLCVALAAAAFLTASDALGLPLTPGERFVYWISLLGPGVLAGDFLFLRLSRAAERSRPWAWALVLTAVTTPVATAWVAAANLVAGFAPGLGDMPRLIALVGLLNGAVTALAVLAHNFRAPPSPAPAAAFRRRLPAALREAEILAVEAQGHGLKVRTSAGAVEIWHGLTRAAKELEALDGRRVHRSWWVARSAVARAERMGRGAVLTLRDGTRVPVSRGRLDALRAWDLF